MGSLAAGTAFRTRAAASPNDTVRVACVGLRGRGKSHIHAYSQMPNVEIAAFCDIDESVLNGAVSALEKAKGKRPAAFTEHSKAWWRELNRSRPRFRPVVSSRQTRRTRVRFPPPPSFAKSPGRCG